MSDFKATSASLSDFQLARDDSRESKGLQYLKTLIGSSTLTRKDKNEPARFLGDGVSFKAKLIGILEVSEARGDRMCQEALSDLKMAIRAAGEHKQRININIAIDGLRLRDEKTGDCLYHHPVHKISFIAQDMSDSRAFGYIFGSPDTGHRFFGIKTDKAASQVVITMRDLFQVVFELKKKEIEMAKQHIEQHQIKYSSPLFPETTSKSSAEPQKVRPIAEDCAKENPSTSTGESQEHIMDLLDLELELNNIQQGINQMDRITPSDPFGPPVLAKSSADPFGDSFNPVTKKGKLPPPPDSGRRPKPSDKHWFDHETEALFEETELPNSLASIQSDPQPSFPGQSISTSPLPTTDGSGDVTADTATRKLEAAAHDQFDVFTDLDPLGTGRSKPYVDKKDFFQDLKNPPKKVLKDLVTGCMVDGKFLLLSGGEKGTTSSGREITDLVQSGPCYYEAFPEDPFDSDPFSEVDFSQTAFTPSGGGDPFEKFADFSSSRRGSGKEERYIICDRFRSARGDPETAKLAPLKVSLPPEKLGTTPFDGSSNLSPSMSRRSKLQKANSMSTVLRPPSPSPKQKNRIRALNYELEDVFADKGCPIMEGVLQRGRTSSGYASMDRQSPDVVAPEPPPRLAIHSASMKPPPLPPKRAPVPISTKPPPRPPHSDYDYIENYQSTSYVDAASPPLPAPARKQAAGPTKHSTEPDYYLQPFPLLPPPKKKGDLTRPPAAPETKPTAAPPSTANKSLDITLSQLTKTGFSDLAAMLNLSPSSLSKMTLQDLTKCLSSLTTNDSELSTKSSESAVAAKSGALTSECYTALRDSIEEDTTTFKAEFDAHFDSGAAKKEEESLFDKYAVFRELLEEEKRQDDEVGAEDNSAAPSPYTLKEDDEDEEEEEEDEEGKTMLPSDLKAQPAEDRYAALREICLDEVVEEKYGDLSDKEDSIIEQSSRLEEDTDLLPQSRAHSESTESPTVTMKEPQSIIEATIMEEDISALEVDDEEVPEDSTMCDVVPQDSPQLDCSRGAPTDKFCAFPEVEAKPVEPTASWAKFDSVAPPLVDNSSVHSEGHISPWSNESKDNDNVSPACRDKRKHRKMRRPKTASQWQEDEESEEGWEGGVGGGGAGPSGRAERNWSPTWRENGWSDGDSLYGEGPPYVERDYPSPRRIGGRRRRVSPWNSRDQSPWEEDERELSEDQWEAGPPRWQDEPRQRPKPHRGPPPTDERRRHYEDPRKLRKSVPWSSDVERKSSRESLAWEDEERYQNRNYIDRRRKKWEEDSHNRNRGWREREWNEPGGNVKLSNRYYKDRESAHWESEYSGEGHHGEEDGGGRWASRRPRSCDRGRRQFSSHHSSESDFSERRYGRSRDSHEAAAADYRRKVQTLQSQKQRRKHSQSSPFEDDFSSQFFPKDSPIGSNVFDPKSPQTAESKKAHSMDGTPDQAKGSGSGVPQPSDHHSWEAGGGKSSRSYQQSPFEDDFAPADTRQCSGRSASSDLSDPPRTSDDMFFDSARPNRRPKSANPAAHRNNNRAEPLELAEPSVDRRDPKPRSVSLHRSDSTSSLRKSESVNIFTRTNDPFDDDFFFEDSAAPRLRGDKYPPKGHSSIASKWSEPFASFAFDGDLK